MKNVKDLGIKTKEGLEVGNLQRFPSMEYGEDGGLQADVFLHGIKMLTVFQKGDGGCAITHLTESGSISLGKLKEAGLNFLKRVDENYGPNTKYKWLQEKTIKTFDDDDWQAVVENIEERYDDLQAAKTRITGGASAVIVCKNDWETLYMSTHQSQEDFENDAMFKYRLTKTVEAHLATKYPETKFTSIQIFLPADIKSSIL